MESCPFGRRKNPNCWWTPCGRWTGATLPSAWQSRSRWLPLGRNPGGTCARARGHAPAEAPALTDAQLAKRAGRKLYVLAPSRAEMEGIKAECAAHPGDVPVYVKLKDEGIALLLNRTFWCDGEAETLSRLRGRYGEDGVVLRE